MSEQAAVREQQDRILSEMAELGLSFARKLEARVELVTSVDEGHALARAYDRVTRSARLSIALQNKLARDRLEIAKLERTANQRAAERRKAQIKTVLEDEIFVEARDQHEADALAERLVERLDAEALFDTFLTTPFPKATARIRKDIGLPVPPPQGGGGGPSVEEPMVEGARHGRWAPAAPAVTPSAGRATSPVISATGEEKKKPGPS